MTSINPTQYIKKCIFAYRNTKLCNPYIEEQQKNRRKESQPDLPPDPRALRHAQHAVHVPLDPRSRVLEGVVEV